MQHFTPPLTLRIEPDPDPCNPRKEFDNAGHMVCWHRRYNLGDFEPQCGPDNYLLHLADEKAHFKCRSEDVPEKHIAAVLEKHYVILPLYLYDHSGLSISTGKFSCPWDSGQVGYTYISLKEAQAERTDIDKSKGWDAPANWSNEETITLRDWAQRILESEVEEYDQYLSGDVWGYVIEDENGEHVDSCWGFYGRKFCEEEGQSMLAYHNEVIAKIESETQAAMNEKGQR